MATFTSTWNAAFEAAPADTDNVSGGAGKIRETRQATQERLVENHSWAGNGDDGKHKDVVFLDTTDVTTAANELAIYSKDSTGSKPFWREESDGTVHQLSDLDSTQTLTNKTLTDVKGQVAVPVGSAAAPSYTFTGDLNTGIFSTADALGLVTGGVNRMSLTTTQLDLSVGIRTDTGGTGEYLKTKVIEIGDWDMNSTATVTVAHGLTQSKIRDVNVVIRNDAASLYYNLPVELSSLDYISGYEVQTTNIELKRLAADLFGQSANFNDGSSFNRGWITILYSI